MQTPHPSDPASPEPVARLSDPELLAALRRLLREERRVTARLLSHLGEVDARGLYRHDTYSAPKPDVPAALRKLNALLAERDYAARSCSSASQQARSSRAVRPVVPEPHRF